MVVLTVHFSSLCWVLSPRSFLIYPKFWSKWDCMVLISWWVHLSDIVELHSVKIKVGWDKFLFSLHWLVWLGWCTGVITQQGEGWEKHRAAVSECWPAAALLAVSWQLSYIIPSRRNLYKYLSEGWRYTENTEQCRAPAKYEIKYPRLYIHF